MTTDRPVMQNKKMSSSTRRRPKRADCAGRADVPKNGTEYHKQAPARNSGTTAGACLKARDKGNPLHATRAHPSRQVPKKRDGVNPMRTRAHPRRECLKTRKGETREAEGRYPWRRAEEAEPAQRASQPHRHEGPNGTQDPGPEAASARPKRHRASSERRRTTGVAPRQARENHPASARQQRPGGGGRSGHRWASAPESS